MPVDLNTYAGSYDPVAGSRILAERFAVPASKQIAALEARVLEYLAQIGRLETALAEAQHELRAAA